MISTSLCSVLIKFVQSDISVPVVKRFADVRMGAFATTWMARVDVHQDGLDQLVIQVIMTRHVYIV